MGVLDGATEKLGSMGFNFQNIMTAVGGFVLLVIVCGLCGFTIWYFTTKKAYNKNIEVWEKKQGMWHITKKDVATEIFLPMRNIKLFQLKKLKTNYNKYLPIPQLSVGFNTYWYFIGKDGEWINTCPEDFDEKRARLGLMLDQTDMKNQRAALQKLLSDNYKSKKWWLEYAPYIALGILILFLGVSAWLISDKLLEGISLSNQNIQSQIDLVNLQRELLGAMDNYDTGSGLREVGT